MKRIILLGIGAMCIPSLVVLGCNDRSATNGYDGGFANTTQTYDGGFASTGMDSSSKATATEVQAKAGAGAWEGGLSSRQ